MIQEIASVEIAKVELEAAARKDQRPDKKVQALNAQLKALEAKLNIVEQQFRVLNRHLDRLGADPSAAAR